MHPAINPRTDKLLLRIRLVPNASQNRIEGLHNDALKIRLKALPREGKANKALLKFLAKALDLQPACLVLAKGEQSRNKVIAISNANADDISRCLTKISMTRKET